MTLWNFQHPRNLAFSTYTALAITLADLVRGMIGIVFLYAAFTKAFESDVIHLAIDSTLRGTVAAEWVVGGLVALEAGLGAALILNRRCVVLLMIAGSTLLGFSLWLVYAHFAFPSLSCGCFGDDGFLRKELGLGASLIRNGLLLFACIVLVMQQTGIEHQTVFKGEQK